MNFLAISLLLHLCCAFSQPMVVTSEQKFSLGALENNSMRSKLDYIEAIKVFPLALKESSLLRTSIFNFQLNITLSLLILFTLSFIGAKKCILLSILLCSIPLVSSQGFITKYGGNNKNYFGSSMKPLSDGGFYITGYTNNGGTNDMWVYRINNQGTIIWNSVISCNQAATVYSLELTDDGGCLVVASHYASCTGSAQAIYLARYTSSGSMTWFKDITTLGNVIPQQLMKIDTELFIIVGYVPTSGIIIQITGAGNLGWYVNYGTYSNEVLYAAVMLADSSFVAVGSVGSRDVNNPSRSCYMVWATSSGTLTTTKTFPRGTDAYCCSIALLSDGTLGVLGSSKGGSGSLGDYDIWYMKMDTLGNTVSLSRVYGGQLYDSGVSIKQTADGSLFIGGTSASAPAHNSKDILLIKIDLPTGNSLWSADFGGYGDEYLAEMDTTSSSSIALIGQTNSNTGDYTYAYVISEIFSCSPGSYYDTTSDLCQPCPMGTYNALASQNGIASCIACAIGYYQNLQGSTSCLRCPINTYTSSTQSASCNVCLPGWNTSVAQDKCLYKGIFYSVASFNADNMSINCFPNGTIVKPFSQACRAAFRNLCCIGSTKNTSVSCNFGLELSTYDSMYDKYCSACSFANQLRCPPDGLCWSDQSYTSNAINPYPTTFSSSCLQAIGGYCSPRIIVNSSDPECYMFSSFCGAKVISNAYFNQVTFRITFSLPLAPLPSCNTIFDSTRTPYMSTGTISCTLSTPNNIDVKVSGLSLPITMYSFNIYSVQDFCMTYISPFNSYWVSTPSPPAESVVIIGNTSDKCMGLTLNSKTTVSIV